LQGFPPIRPSVLARLASKQILVLARLARRVFKNKYFSGKPKQTEQLGDSNNFNPDPTLKNFIQ
jgi:hypothetical protein